jgi:hypothetical protein
LLYELDVLSNANKQIVKLACHSFEILVAAVAIVHLESHAAIHHLDAFKGISALQSIAFQVRSHRKSDWGGLPSSSATSA